MKRGVFACVWVFTTKRGVFVGVFVDVVFFLSGVAFFHRHIQFFWSSLLPHLNVMKTSDRIPSHPVVVVRHFDVDDDPSYVWGRLRHHVKS